MLKELYVLKLFTKNKEYYDKYYHYIISAQLDQEVKLLFNCVDSYYSSYPEHVYIGLSELQNYFSLEYSNYKNPEIALKLIEEVYSIEISDSLIKDYISQMLEKDASAKIINKLLSVVDESKTGQLLTVREDIAKFEELIKVNNQNDSVFVTNDLDQLLEEEYSGSVVNWRLRSLQETCGPVREGLYHIYARPNCFSPDTEVLTPSGWAPVADITYEDFIAQVDGDRNISFVKPSHIEKHYEDNMLLIHDTLGRVKLHVSQDHDMAFQYGDVKELRKKSAKDIIYFQGVKHHVAGKSKAIAELLTPHERLEIAYQADGHSRSYRDYGYTFSFKKERKIKRLQQILKACGYEYNIYKDGNNGNIGFYVKTTKPLHKDFSWVDLSNVSVLWGKAFIQELSHWDSTLRSKTRFKFNTANKKVADVVQAIGVLSEHNVLINKYHPTGNKKHAHTYELSIRSAYKPVDGGSIKKESTSWSGDVYCFTVPDGFLLVRRDGATAIAGNTGKTSLIASEVTNFAGQLQDNECILYFNNEEKGNRVQLRLYSAMLGVPIEDILAQREKAKEVFTRRGGSKIKLYDNAYISIEDIDRLCLEYSPRIVVVDIADKVTFRGAGHLEGTMRLKELYRKYREQAKIHGCAFITAGQASAEGHGKKWLEMTHMDWSKTGKAGELDISLGIGKSLEEGKEGIRYIHVNKNKFTGEEAKISVILNSKTGRYSDME